MSLHPEKKPFKLIRKWKEGEVRFAEYEADTWVDGIDDDGNGNFIFGPRGYKTYRGIVSSKNWRSKMSRNVSYFPELAKALGV